MKLHFTVCLVGFLCAVAARSEASLFSGPGVTAAKKTTPKQGSYPSFTVGGKANFAPDSNPWASYEDLCSKIHDLGYPCEHHYPVTNDGFVLNIVRIPGKKDAYPVIMQHGLLDSAVAFVANAHPYQNLGCMLSDAGYDVWLPNARGNYYSTKNIYYNQSDDEYWRLIDFDKMASEDLPTVINYVTNFTKQPTVTYGGHSQGGMMGVLGFSTTARQVAHKVDLFVGLAPATFVAHTDAPLIQAAQKLVTFSPESMEGLGNTFLMDNMGLLIRTMSELCDDLGMICPDMLELLTGDGKASHINRTNFDVITKYTPAGTGGQNMIHFAQAATQGLSQADYGWMGNRKYYNGSNTAPKYNISALTVPFAVFFSLADGMCDPKDMNDLLDKLPNGTVVKEVNAPNFGHLDFVWGITAYKVIYPEVMKLIAQYKRK